MTEETTTTARIYMQIAFTPEERALMSDLRAKTGWTYTRVVREAVAFFALHHPLASKSPN